MQQTATPQTMADMDLMQSSSNYFQTGFMPAGIVLRLFQGDIRVFLFSDNYGG